MIGKHERTPAEALPGFESFNRFWLESHQKFAIKVKPGEHYVTRHDELLVTTLGSCISACVRDEAAGLGGMNHFILPEASGGRSILSAEMRYGTFAMEQLINDLLRFGAQRDRLEVKITGGGQMLGQLSAIGKQNVAFIRDFLQTEGLAVTSEDLGGTMPRKVMYIPQQGRMLVKRMANTHMNRLVEAEAGYRRQLDTQMEETDIELF